MGRYRRKHSTRSVEPRGGGGGGGGGGTAQERFIPPSTQQVRRTSSLAFRINQNAIAIATMRAAPS